MLKNWVWAVQSLFSSDTSFADAVAKVYRMYKRRAGTRLDTSDELPSGCARLEDASDERTALFSRIKHSYHPTSDRLCFGGAEAPSGPTASGQQSGRFSVGRLRVKAGGLVTWAVGRMTKTSSSLQFVIATPQAVCITMVRYDFKYKDRMGQAMYGLSKT